MIIMLPHDTVSFNKLVKELPGEQLESILSTMHMKKVFVFMPRFSCEHTSHLVPILQAVSIFICFYFVHSNFKDSFQHILILHSTWNLTLKHSCKNQVSKENTAEMKLAEILVFSTLSQICFFNFVQSSSALNYMLTLSCWISFDFSRNIIFHSITYSSPQTCESFWKKMGTSKSNFYSFVSSSNFW